MDPPLVISLMQNLSDGTVTIKIAPFWM